MEVCCRDDIAKVSHLRMLWRHRPALGQVFAAGNLDNRHVEIVCAASAHVNVSVLYQFVDSATQPWPTSVAPRRGFLSRSGSAWPSRSQKDGLPSCRGECGQLCGSRPSTRAQGRGSLVAAPSNRGAEMDAKSRDLALLSFLSLSCAVSAWAGDRDIFGSVFFALGTVAMLGAAYGQRR